MNNHEKSGDQGFVAGCLDVELDAHIQGRDRRAQRRGKELDIYPHADWRGGRG
jgi:hypothetical protein